MDGAYFSLSIWSRTSPQRNDQQKFLSAFFLCCLTDGCLRCRSVSMLMPDVSIHSPMLLYMYVCTYTMRQTHCSMATGRNDAALTRAPSQCHQSINGERCFVSSSQLARRAEPGTSSYGGPSNQSVRPQIGVTIVVVSSERQNRCQLLLGRAFLCCA